MPDDSDRADRRWWWPGVGVAVAIALWMTRSAWGGRPPAGDDVMAHIVRGDFGLSHLAEHFRVDGWFPRFMLGHQEFLFYGQGFTWLLGAVRLIALGTMSTTGAMKVVAIGSFVAFGPAVVFLARSMGLSRLASMVAGVLALAVNNVFGIGLAGIFVIGLVPQQAAAVAACIGMGAALRMLTDRGPNGARRWPVMAAVSFAFVAVTHVISVLIVGFFLVIAIAALLVTERPPLAAWRRLLWTALATAGLSAFWLLPSLAHRDLRGPVTTWATPPIGQRVHDILAGQILFGPHIGWLAVLGVPIALWMVVRRRPFAAAFLVAPAAFLVLSHNVVHWFPGNELAVQPANRGLGYAGLFALFPIAAAIAAVCERLPLARIVRVSGSAAAGTSALALGLAGFVVLVLPGSNDSGAQQVRQQAAAVPAMYQAAAVLAQVVPPGARFATERHFPQEITDTGVSHPDFWLASRSGRDTVNIFNVESSSVHDVVFAPESIADQPAEATANALAPLGVTHVVTVDPATATKLAASPRFRLVWQSQPLAVFELRPVADQPPPASLLSTTGPADASLVSARPERLVISTEAAEPTTATAAVAWSPKWHLHIDGRPAALGHDEHGLLRFALPAGAHAVTLTYHSDAADRIGTLISLLTLIAGAVWLRRTSPRHYPRRRSSSSSSRMSSSLSRTA